MAVGLRIDSSRTGVFAVLLLHLLPQTLAALSNTLFIYTQSSLGNISASDSCIQALTANVTCYANLGAAVIQISEWSSGALDLMCSDACTDSLNNYISTIDNSCGSDTLYNISGTLQTADGAGKEMLWKQSTTCLKDPNSGEYCNLLFQQEAINGTTRDPVCQDCALEYLTAIANSQWGQQIINPDAVSSQISSCSATGYSVTYIPTTTSTTASEISATATALSGNTRCNITDPDTATYVSNDNQTCTDISKAMNVSTPALTSKNALDSSCTSLPGNITLCLPSICQIYMVQANETCDVIIGNLTHQVSLTTFRSWNPSINSACSNLNALEGQYICISPPGYLTIPSGFPFITATTAAPVPTDYVTTSNTDCGTWYRILDGDTCQSVADEFDISLSDFYFLNPQLNTNCTSLWLGNSYCVQAVGNIETYSGYSVTTTNMPTLGTIINLNSTKTANRSTTHFFGYTPPAVTTTVLYNGTVYNMTENYTLCDNALAYYNITSADNFTDVEYDNSAWWSEYTRICWLNLTAPLPTTPFNTSIILSSTDSTVGSTTTSGTPSAGASSTIVSASATTSSTPTPTITISPDGLCGNSTGYICEGSQFGDCCSIYGYCGSTDDYCRTNCDPQYGLCSTTSASSSTTTSSSATATSSDVISPSGLCGSSTGYTCKGSQFGDCCSKYGYCGSGDDYCGSNCDANYGECN